MREIYLDNAASSKPHASTLAKAQEFVEIFSNPDKSASDITRQLRGSLTEARQAVASYIHCDEDEVALIQCTTHGMGIIANAIPMEKGDNVLVCDLEYQASTVCWMPLCKTKGIEIKAVKTTGGKITVEDFENAIDEHTKAITIASVQEINGYRCDLKAITEMAHRHGLYVAADGVQEVGAMEVDVHDTGVDFYCAGAKKWVGNPFGTGFLYIKREVAQKLEPMYYGYFSMKVPDRFPDYVSYLEDPSRTPYDDYGVINDATKFEIMGYANYLGAMGLTQAIRVQQAYGTARIEREIKEMIGILLAGLKELGIKPCSPTDIAHQSSIASFNFGFPCGDISREKKLVPYLQERGVKISLRSSTGTGGIRISVHYYNTPEQIRILLQGIADFMKENNVSQDT